MSKSANTEGTVILRHCDIIPRALPHFNKDNYYAVMGEEDDDMVLKDTEIAIPYKKNTTIGKTNFKDNFVQGVSKYFNIPADSFLYS